MPAQRKLTEEQKAALVASPLSIAKAALLFGVSPSTVQQHRALAKRPARDSVAVTDHCAHCGQSAPKNKRYGGGSWKWPYGHRCTHGEPCPSSGPVVGDNCAACVAAREVV